jgi:hypothetical protein
MIRGAAGVKWGVAACNNVNAWCNEDAVYWFSVGVLVTSCGGTAVSVLLEDRFMHPHLAEGGCCFTGSNVFVCVHANDNVIALLLPSINFF